MAMYESLSPRDRMTTTTYGGARPATSSSTAMVAERLAGPTRMVLLTFLLLCWMAGAYAGIVYWSLQGSLLGVIASALVPGLAATSTWSAFTALERPRRR